MKNQPEFITKMQEKVEEIRLAQEEVNLATDPNAALKQEVKKIVQNIANKYGYGEDDAVYFLCDYMKKLGYIKNFSV
jgi:hypothetical protein